MAAVALPVLALSALPLSSCAAPLEKTAAAAVNQSTSAVGTAILSLELLDREQAGAPVVETSLEDMADEIGKARKDLLGQLPATASERRLHRETAAALDRAQSALSLARNALASKDPSPDTSARADALAALQRSAAELEPLRKRLGTGR